MFLFNNWFFDRFPPYFKNTDTYKDSEGKGIFERFLSIFGVELDEVIMPLLRNQSDIVNPQTSKDLLNEILGETQENDKYLNLIAYTLGNPPHRDIYKTPEQVERELRLYRNLLSMTASLDKIRGTAKSLVIWGNLLGLELIIYQSKSLRSRYDEIDWDSSVEGFDGLTEATYDSDCSTCSDYIVLISKSICDPEHPGNEIDDSTMEILKRVICYNEPINARLKSLISQSLLCDTVNKCADEVITIDIEASTTYDSNVKYDFTDTYDVDGVDTQTIINDSCNSGIGFWAIEDDFVVGP